MMTATSSAAQTGSEGLLGGLLGGGGGGKGPKTPEVEAPGNEINLVSKNVHEVGMVGPNMPGADAWLGNLPGMGSLKAIFQAQVSNK